MAATRKSTVKQTEKSEAVRFLEALAGPLTFGQHLQAIRKGDELNQTAFAALLGISKQHLCDVEHGRKAVSAERASAWARKLGYSEPFFLQLALQDELDRAGLSRYRVNVEAA